MHEFPCVINHKTHLCYCIGLRVSVNKSCYCFHSSIKSVAFRMIEAHMDFFINTYFIVCLVIKHKNNTLLHWRSWNQKMCGCVIEISSFINFLLQLTNQIKITWSLWSHTSLVVWILLWNARNIFIFFYYFYNITQSAYKTNLVGTMWHCCSF